MAWMHVLDAHPVLTVEEYLAGTVYWTLRTHAGLDASLHLDSIGCTMPLTDVYERLVFPASAEEGREA
jgi:hypothetical protein